jgi:hypothetical protein
MTTVDAIEAYRLNLSESDQSICARLRGCIDESLPDATSKIWHAHPVWFLDENPIVGYCRLKDCIRLLFWSGQGFDEAGLRPEGKFKAAEARYIDASQVDVVALNRWLQKARAIQWDYKNIVKRKGRLDRLT